MMIICLEKKILSIHNVITLMKHFLIKTTVIIIIKFIQKMFI